jgi:hypothetical protein
MSCHVMFFMLCCVPVMSFASSLWCVVSKEMKTTKTRHCSSSGFHITDSDVAPVMVSEGGLGDGWCVLTSAGHHAITIR